MIGSSNKTHTAYLLIGGNLGDRLNNLSKAINRINQTCGTIQNVSSIYETAAWGFTNQPHFLNQVIVLNTVLQPSELMQQLLHIEEEMGRKRLIKMGPRIIDLDILLIDDFILDSPILQLPHPQLINRKFALLPLNEVAATFVHPVEKKTISQLLQECKDNLDVQKI